MARFSGPDEWTGDYWKSLLRFTSKADATSKAEILVGVNLHNFDTESPYAQLPGRCVQHTHPHQCPLSQCRFQSTLLGGDEDRGRES